MWCVHAFACVCVVHLFVLLGQPGLSVPVDLPYLLLFKFQTFLSNVKQSLSCPRLSPGLVIDPSFPVQQFYPTGMSAVFLIQRHMTDDVHELALKNILFESAGKEKD